MPRLMPYKMNLIRLERLESQIDRIQKHKFQTLKIVMNNYERKKSSIKRNYMTNKYY